MPIGLGSLFVQPLTQKDGRREVPNTLCIVPVVSVLTHPQIAQPAIRVRPSVTFPRFVIVLTSETQPM